MGQTLQFTASLGAGLLLGLVNWALWARWTKDLLGKELNWGWFLARSGLKLAGLGVILWYLLARHHVNPGGFLTGFSFVVIILVIKGLKWR